MNIIPRLNIYIKPKLRLVPTGLDSVCPSCGEEMMLVTNPSKVRNQPPYWRHRRQWTHRIRCDQP